MRFPMVLILNILKGKFLSARGCWVYFSQGILHGHGRRQLLVRGLRRIQGHLVRANTSVCEGREGTLKAIGQRGGLIQIPT